MLKKILAWVGGALGILVVVAGLLVARLRSPGRPPEGDLVLQGLDAPVEVLYDSLGVPHVWAASERDLLFAQGFVHARDRLWQMEMFRRVAQGRLSELFGERTLSTDRFLRTLDFRRAAEVTASALDVETAALAEAYAGGVNAALEAWEGPLPPELVILRVDPEPWEPVSSLAIEKIMAWDLTQYGSSLALARAREALGPEKYEMVAPRYPEWGVTILDGTVADRPGGVAATVSAETEGPPPSVSAGLLAAAEPPPVAIRLLEKVSAVRASNSWVVGGSRSSSGRPLLANDMHLGLDAPPIWYLMGLHAPGIDIVGMTLPGTPWVVAGHSSAVAWGFTNAAVDDGDFFVERLDPEDSTRYLTPGGSEPFVARLEEIPVRGRDEPDSLVVRETRHGPVMTPVGGSVGGEILAFRWVAFEPSTTSRALREMARARTVSELVEALRSFTDPHQNVVFADTAGSFGYWMAGSVPLRRSGRPSILPVPGWTGEYDWVGWLPFEEHPHVLDPGKGFVVTANNRQSRDSVSLLISRSHWERPYRAQKITELVEARGLHDAASMGAIQMHVGSAFVDRYLERAVVAFRAAEAEEPARSLERWDRRSTLESTEATLFFTWVEGLQERLRGRLYGAEGGYYPLYALERALDGGEPWVDSLAADAARDAAEHAGTPWGRVHLLTLDHPLAGVPLLGRVLGFGRAGIPRAGSHHSPNVASFGGSTPPFTVRSGPSQRHVVDMSDPDASGGFIVPGGESGYPGSPHAWDQLPRWREGTLWLLPLSREKVEARTVRELRLHPSVPH